MEKNKKGMFTGFSKVFQFTAMQNLKGKGFRLSTILLAVILAAGFSLISIFMAISQSGSEENTGDLNEIMDLDEAMDIDVYYINNSAFSDEYIQGIINADAFKNSTFTAVDEADQIKAVENTNGYLTGKRDALVMHINENEEKLLISCYLPYETDIGEGTAETFGAAFENYLEYIKINELAGLDENQLLMYHAGAFSQALPAGEEAQDISIILTKIFVPMLFSLLLYMMILLYGQNITKIVVAEKSSKLMETLLTSVKPYAIIAGKILAVSGIAIVQLILWILAAAGGYVIGEVIAESINPDYINYMSLIMETIGGSSDAFSAGAIVVAVLMIVVGFFMYSVAAGLVASMVDKMEDISSVMSLFQVPVIIGFMGAYFVQMSENAVLHGIVRYFPITSPFCVPAEIMVGSMDIMQGITALVIVAAVSFCLIILTGRIYKGKLFNRH